jgi:hypothetical protein
MPYRTFRIIDAGGPVREPSGLGGRDIDPESLDGRA